MRALSLAGLGGSPWAPRVAAGPLQHIPLPGDQSYHVICGRGDLGLVGDDLKGRL